MCSPLHHMYQRMCTQCLEHVQVMSKHSLLFTKTSCHGNHTTSYIRTFHISTINSGINGLLYVNKHLCTDTYIHAHIHTRTCTQKHTDIHMQIHATYTHAHMDASTHAHTHMHTCTLPCTHPVNPGNVFVNVQTTYVHTYTLYIFESRYVCKCIHNALHSEFYRVEVKI